MKYDTFEIGGAPVAPRSFSETILIGYVFDFVGG